MKKYREAIDAVSWFVINSDRKDDLKWACQELNTLVDKEEAINVVSGTGYYRCPKCKLVVSNIETGFNDNGTTYESYETPSYCKWCGQKLDWTERS